MHLSRATAVSIFAAACLSIWLRSLFPPLGIWGSHDDYLFIRLAASLEEGAWLGSFDQLTLAKGMFYPFFVWLSHVTGLPLKLAEQALYLLAALATAFASARLTNLRGLLLPIFLILAFSPLFWMVEQARVIRETIYVSLGLGLFSLYALHLREEAANKYLGIAVGLLGGCYWLTREEGIWLLPALAVLSLPWLYRFFQRPREAGPTPIKRTFAAFVPIAAGFLLVVGTVNAINYEVYGVFRNNDFRSGTFAKAYGALSRIEHDRWQRYVVFPRDARLRAYSVSPAARELESYFEGEPGRNWASVSRDYPPPWGCTHQPTACNEEILSGWFIWALRDAVENNGHYRSARAADNYYKRLSREINTACDTGLLLCHTERASLLPVWRDRYLNDTLDASKAVLRTLLVFTQQPVGVPDSPLDATGRAVFEKMLNSPVSGPSSNISAANDAGQRIAQSIAGAYAAATPALPLLALVCYGLLFATWIATRAKRVSTGAIVVLTAAAVAVLSRIAMLGFLEATSMPSNNLLYLSPAIPFYLLFVVGSTCIGSWAFWRLASARWRQRG